MLLPAQIKAIDSLVADFEQSLLEERHRLFTCIKELYDYAYPLNQQVAKLDESNFLKCLLRHRKRFLRKRNVDLPEQGIILLHDIFAECKISSVSSALLRHSFTPNQNLAALMIILDIKHHSPLGEGPKQLCGNDWSKLFSFLGCKWEQQQNYLAPGLVRLLADVPCNTIHCLFNEIDAKYYPPLEIESRHIATLKLLISASRYTEFRLWEYALDDPSLKWLESLYLKRLASLSQDTQFFIQNCVLSLLKSLLSIEIPGITAHNRDDLCLVHKCSTSFEAATWAIPLVELFLVKDDGCCVYGIWSGLEREIERRMGEFLLGKHLQGLVVISNPSTYT